MGVIIVFFIIYLWEKKIISSQGYEENGCIYFTFPNDLTNSDF